MFLAADWETTESPIMADTELRQRKPQGDDKPAKKASATKPKSKADDDDYSPWLDILRVLSFIFVASCGLSYVISGGESLFWGMKNKPNYLRADWWKAQMVRLLARKLVARNPPMLTSA